MPVVKIDSALFDVFDNLQLPPLLQFEYVDQLNTLTLGQVLGDMRVLQVSSSLIRLEQDFVSSIDPNMTETVELRMEGSGIGPVSSLQALIDAINTGLATGAVNHVGVVFTGGAEVLSVEIGANGYVVASGAQSVVVGGTLPLTFEQLSEFVGLAGRALTLADLTRDERNALFAELGAFGVTDLQLQYEGETYLGLHVGAEKASLSVLGLTFAVTGTFPDNFGEDLQLLWQMLRIYTRTADPLAVAEFVMGAFAIDGFKMTDASGQVVMRVANPLEGGPVVWQVDGQTYDAVTMGIFSEDLLKDARGSSSAMVGLWGNDKMLGLGAADYLNGGLGRDTLDGGSGADILLGGAGRDRLLGGIGADEFRFDRKAGADVIADFEVGVDHIAIRGAGALFELDFTQIGDDVLIEFGKLDVLVRGATVAEMGQDGNFLF